jgi:L-amino acid N-acyltransferase YncA
LRTELVVRRAREDDLVTVAAIHRESIVALCSAAYSPEQIAQWIAGRTMERYAKLFAERRMFVCERASGTAATQGESASAASLGAVGQAIVGFGILDVESKRVFAVYVAPSAVFGGVGRRLLEVMETDARAEGIERLQLHATLNAARFYERSGYIDEGATKVTLSTGVELDAVLMSKRLVP